MGTDCRLRGPTWFFDCHALLVLPKTLIPSSHLISEEKLTVILDPEVKEDDVNSYLTYVYSGSIPSVPEEFQGFIAFIKFLWSLSSAQDEDNLVGNMSLGSGSDQDIVVTLIDEVEMEDNNIDANELDTIVQSEIKKNMKVLNVPSKRYREIIVPDNIKCDYYTSPLLI